MVFFEGLLFGKSGSAITGMKTGDGIRGGDLRFGLGGQLRFSLAMIHESGAGQPFQILGVCSPFQLSSAHGCYAFPDPQRQQFDWQTRQGRVR
jgi:hypothetical protein